MSTQPERLDATAVDNEERLIDEARWALCEEFPSLPADRVRVVVECIWAEYDDARIRDFIPVLVRKQAREELRDQLPTKATDTTPTRRVAGPPEHPWPAQRRSRQAGQMVPRTLIPSPVREPTLPTPVPDDNEQRA